MNPFLSLFLLEFIYLQIWVRNWGFVGLLQFKLGLIDSDANLWQFLAPAPTLRFRLFYSDLSTILAPTPKP